MLRFITRHENVMELKVARFVEDKSMRVNNEWNLCIKLGMMNNDNKWKTTSKQLKNL